MKRRPRPISLSNIIRGQLLALAKTRPESSSVELTRNAKGNVQINVSVAREEGESFADAVARAQQTYDALAKRYPHKASE